MKLPKKALICECWTRDGIQGESQFIPTEGKIAILNQMTQIGFKRIEVTSFAHPKLVKQFADAMEVLKGIERQPGTAYIAVVPNEKALDRVLDCCQAGYGPDEVTTIVSASEEHLLANLEMTMDEAKEGLTRIVRRALGSGLKVIGCIGTSFGCPLAGEVPLTQVMDLADWYLNLGANYIMLGDTTGEANPLQVREVYRQMRERFPGAAFIAHFHDTRGLGIANTWAALEEGIIYHDSSLGGIGGQPATKRPKYHKGMTGNTCTEDLVLLLKEAGIETGLDLEEVMDLGHRVEEVCGRQLLGRTSRSGPVRHRVKEPFSPDQLHLGMAIPPSIFFYHLQGQGLSVEPKDLIDQIILSALIKNYPNTKGLTLDSGAIKRNSELRQREVLFTQFKIQEIGIKNVLEVLCQKSNGEVFFQGPVQLKFS